MSSTLSTLLCHYRYDPLDRLIDQTRPDQPTHQRFYCKSRLATEIQGAMQYSVLQHGDLLLAQQQRLGDEVFATLLATDLQRSVLHTFEKNDQRQAIAYSPYGHRHAENGLTSLLGFNGERPDPVTGHYLLGNGYRAFNPVLMRFNSPDSLSPFGRGGLSPYAYCLGDPINRIDPNGHTSFFAWLKAVRTRKVEYEGIPRKIVSNSSTSEALRGLDRVRELDKLIRKEKSLLPSLRSEKITQDRFQLLEKMQSGPLTVQENKRYVLQDLMYRDFGELHYSYRSLKTFNHQLTTNNYITDKLKTMISEAYPNHTNSINLITEKDIYTYLKPDIKKYLKEIKQVNISIRQTYKSERTNILTSHFHSPF